MNFEPTESQRSAYKETFHFVANSLDLDARHHDEAASFDRDAWRALGDAGLIRKFAPPEFGGAGWDTLTKVFALEAFGKACPDNGLALALSSFVWTILPPLMSFGSEAQKQLYLPELLSGETLAADGITEPQAGSDAMAMETIATPSESGYCISGKKSYIGFGPTADLILLFAKTDPKAGAWGVSAFLVDASTSGIQKSDNCKKMGLRSLPMGDLTFNDVNVPQSALLGAEGSGLSLFNESMEWERGFILATLVGTMERQLEQCITYAKKRKQFGQPIAAFQSVSNRLADMRTRLETCRLTLRKTAWMKDKGHSIALESSMTKLLISESFVASSLDAVRINGARGYLSEYEIERDLRDATGGLIYAGTSDIQRNLIAQLC